MHEGKVGKAVAAPRRRADGDEHRVGFAHRVPEVAREGETAGANVLGDEIRKPRLEDRHLALPKRRDLARVLVDAGHDVAEIGKARARHEAHIAGPNYTDPQAHSPWFSEEFRLGYLLAGIAATGEGLTCLLFADGNSSSSSKYSIVRASPLSKAT